MSRQQAFKKVAQVRPDAKGRIVLGKRARGISSYVLKEDDRGRLLLEPLIEIPAGEKWLFENPVALSRVKKGLEQSARGKIKSLGSFAKFTEDADD